MITIENNMFFAIVEDYVGKGIPVTLQVKGNSMFPLLRNERDLVEFHPYNDGELKRGAIVLFRTDSGFIMHRIIKRSGNNFIIRGDGICKNCEYTTLKDIIAIVKTVTRISLKGRKKVIRCDSFKWRAISNIWLLFTPLRRYIIALLRRMTTPHNIAGYKSR